MGCGCPTLPAASAHKPARCGPRLPLRCTSPSVALCCSQQEELFMRFAEFEEKVKEVERAR